MSSERQQNQSPETEQKEHDRAAKHFGLAMGITYEAAAVGTGVAYQNALGSLTLAAVGGIVLATTYSHEIRDFVNRHLENRQIKSNNVDKWS